MSFWFAKKKATERWQDSDKQGLQMPGHQRAAKIINIGLSSWSQCPHSLDLAALLGCRLLTAVLSSLINELFFFPWLVRLLSMCSAFLSRCSQRNDSNQWYITASHSFHSCLCWFFPIAPRASKRIRPWDFSSYAVSIHWAVQSFRELCISHSKTKIRKFVPANDFQDFPVFKRLRSWPDIFWARTKKKKKKHEFKTIILHLTIRQIFVLLFALP